MRRWTEGEGPLTAVSKQDGRVGMTQKARQLCPFYYWANSFTDRASLLSLISLIPPVQFRARLKHTAVELCQKTNKAYVQQVTFYLLQFR